MGLINYICECTLHILIIETWQVLWRTSFVIGCPIWLIVALLKLPIVMHICYLICGWFFSYIFFVCCQFPSICLFLLLKVYFIYSFPTFFFVTPTFRISLVMSSFFVVIRFLAISHFCNRFILDIIARDDHLFHFLPNRNTIVNRISILVYIGVYLLLVCLYSICRLIWSVCSCSFYILVNNTQIKCPIYRIGQSKSYLVICF